MNSVKIRCLLFCTFLFAAIVAGEPIYVSGSGSETFSLGANHSVSFSFGGSNGVDSVSFSVFVPGYNGTVPPLNATNFSSLPLSTGVLTLDGISSPYYSVSLPQGQAGVVELFDSKSIILAHQEIFGALVFTGTVTSPDFSSTTNTFDILPVNIPEPTTASLFLVGLIGWGAARRRKT